MVDVSATVRANGVPKAIPKALIKDVRLTSDSRKLFPMTAEPTNEFRKTTWGAGNRVQTNQDFGLLKF